MNMKKIIRFLLNQIGYDIFKTKKAQGIISNNTTNTALSKKSTLLYFNNGAHPLEQNTVEINDKFYSDAEVLEEYFNSSRLSFYSRVIELIIAERIDIDSADICDFGCGSGHLLEYLSKSFKIKTSTGFDFSSKAIEYAKANFKGHAFYVKDIYTDIHNIQFDFIICTEVLEHLEYPNKALLNIMLSLKPGGTLLITVPNGRLDTIEEHINFWSPESWKVFISNTLENKAQFSTGGLTEGKHNYAIIRLNN